MQENVVVTQARPLRRALSTNSSASSFTAHAATITEPTGDGVLAMGGAAGGPFGGTIPERAILYPIGLGADNDAFTMRVLGWRRIRGTTTDITLWVPSLMGEFTCTMCAAVGVAGSPVLNTERFIDTVSIVNEPTITAATTRQGTVEMVAPGSDLIGFLCLYLYGVEKLQFTFKQVTNSPTMNCLVGFI